MNEWGPIGEALAQFAADQLEAAERMEAFFENLDDFEPGETVVYHHTETP